MGTAASKEAAKAAGTAGRRQYPSSSSILNSATSTSNAPSQSVRPNASSQVHPNPETSPPSDTKGPHIDLDGRDPQFGSALKRLGPAIAVAKAAPHESAFPTSSQPPLGQQGQNIFPSSSPKMNPSLMIVQAREKTNQQFEEEADGLGRASFTGRSLISARDIREALRMRDEGGMSAEEIERQLRLKSGILSRLGKPGVFGNV